jgi:LmbE family N-acetylglucosaminyl deacetylase
MDLTFFIVKAVGFCYNKFMEKSSKFVWRVGATAIAIVAHPDDEVIWLGATIKRAPLRWTVFSLCRASDRDRAPKFRRVCRLLGAQAIISDLEDEDLMGVTESVPVIKKLIKEKLKNKNFLYIFTHGRNGEYGHPRHQGVHLAVKELLSEERIKPETVFYFNYKKKNPRRSYPLVPKENSDLVIKLSAFELAWKKKIVAYEYGYNPAGIDVGYCTAEEAFKIARIKH